MPKKIILTFLLLLLTKVTFTQKENNNWSFGEGVGITFNTTTPTLYTHPVNAGHEVYECMTSISDNSGNMLFYTNGLKVYESSGSVMSGGDNLLGADDGGGVSAAGIVVVIAAAAAAATSADGGGNLVGPAVAQFQL